MLLSTLKGDGLEVRDVSQIILGQLARRAVKMILQMVEKTEYPESSSSLNRITESKNLQSQRLWIYDKPFTNTMDFEIYSLEMSKTPRITYMKIFYGFSAKINR